MNFYIVAISSTDQCFVTDTLLRNIVDQKKLDTASL